MSSLWNESDDLALATANFLDSFDEKLLTEDFTSLKPNEELPCSFNQYLVENEEVSDTSGESDISLLSPEATYCASVEGEALPQFEEIPPTLPLMPPKPPSQPLLYDLFRYVKILPVMEVAKCLCQAIGDANTQVLDEWPKTVPLEQSFFGTLDIGLVDFGGKKSGTVYQVNENMSILVNYSGDNSQKVKNLYQELPNLKIWRVILLSLIPPEIEGSEWIAQELRGFKNPAYIYNGMALYVFGGEIYSPNDNGSLQSIWHEPSMYGKSYVSLGPSNRETRKRPEKRQRSALDMEAPATRNKQKIQHRV
eukprot:g9007.t1